MKRKATWISLMIAILLISAIPGALAVFVPGTGLTTKVKAYDASDPTATPVTYPDGQDYIELNDTYDKGATFTVNIDVTNVVEMNWYTAGITWDDSILTCDGFDEGTWFYDVDLKYRTLGPNLPMPDSGTGFLGEYADITWKLAKLTPPDWYGNVTGSGTVFTADFTVSSWGFTYIDVIIVSSPQLTTLVDVDNVDLSYNTIDIVFDNSGLAPGPLPPTAVVESIAPPPPRYVDEVLTFTGKNTTAEWGFTGGPTGVLDPIVMMTWDFDYIGNPGVNTASGRIVTHTYTVDGTYYVNLTVYDTRGWNDSVLVSVAIFPKALGAVLDVMTGVPTYNGEGPFMPARPYRAGKEELVELFSKVLYNDCPVVNKEVTFAVYHVVAGDPLPSFTLVLVRTAFTNTSGWATVEYRIPTGWENEEFGAYLVYSYCFIAEAIVPDALIYRVEWVNEIISVETVPPAASWSHLDLAVFNVTIQSWDFIPLPLVITLTLYDDLDTNIAAVMAGPVGRPPVPGFPPGWPYDWWSPTRYYYGDGTMGGLFMEEYILPGTASFLIGAQIPRHAYVGVGTAYVNLFDAFPLPEAFGIALTAGVMGDGQPYCPEMSTTFGIVC